MWIKIRKKEKKNATTESVDFTKNKKIKNKIKISTYTPMYYYLLSVFLDKKSFLKIKVVLFLFDNICPVSQSYYYYCYKQPSMVCNKICQKKTVTFILFIK